MTKVHYFSKMKFSHFFDIDFFRYSMDNEIKKGIKQGKEKGIIQGSKIKAIDIAKNLKKAGISIDIISESSGLSIKEINDLC